MLSGKLTLFLALVKACGLDLGGLVLVLLGDRSNLRLEDLVLLWVLVRALLWVFQKSSLD